MASLFKKLRGGGSTAAGPGQPELPVSEPPNPFLSEPAAPAGVEQDGGKMLGKNPAAYAADDVPPSPQDQYAKPPYHDDTNAPVVAGAAGAAAVAAPAAAVPMSKTERASTNSHNLASLLGVGLWIVLVTGLTAYQVVQNGLYIGDLSSLSWARAPAASDASASSYAGTEIKALWAIMGIEAGLCLAFLVTAIWLVMLPAIRAWRQGQRMRRMKRANIPWLITLLLVASAWFKLFALSSLLNKMLYQGTYCTNDSSMDLVYTFKPQSTQEGALSCTPAPQTDGIRLATMFAYITIGFHTLVYFAHQPYGLRGKVLGFLPAVLIMALLNVKPFFALQTMHYAEQYYNVQGIFSYKAEPIVCIISFITAVWLGLYMGWAAHTLRIVPRFTNSLLACCGKDYEDVYYEKQHVVERRANPAYDPTIPTTDMEAPSPSSASRHHHKDPHAASSPGSPTKRSSSYGSSAAGAKSYSLRAALMFMLQQFYLVTQLPAVFGFIAPMIVYFGLDVTVWWVVADIIAGAAFLALYMLLCAFHRKIMYPKGARNI